MTSANPVVAIPEDTIGAFVVPPRLLVAGAVDGPLAGRRLAVKDLFDVEGVVAGAGNPTFAKGRTTARSNAPAVQRLVDAGASVIGTTITDELAYSLSGTNVHHGTPRNVAAPGRIPGGSSAGSAAAVAAGLADLALGTDTGGSVRVPASYCGVAGWRPTHGAVDIHGVVPLAPSFDTVGLFATTVGGLVAGAAALLDGSPVSDVLPTHLSVAAETLADADGDVAAELLRVARTLGAGSASLALGVDLDAALVAFRHLQGREAWIAHGAWIERVRPAMGPGITSRFRAAAAVTDDEVAAAAVVRAAVRAAVLAATADGTVLMLPGAAGVAPVAGAQSATHELQRTRTLRLTCVAGLAGVPVVVAPLARIDGLPLGIAFAGAPGTDLALLRFVAALTGAPVTSGVPT